jgi:alkylation response protein AidB-like acyl-CoA dehydrogenase
VQVTRFEDSALIRAKSLYASIAASAPTIDAERQLPPTLVEQLVKAGLFRLLTPKWLAGEELDWLDYLDVVRTIASADGSTAWCINQACVFATTAARVSASLAREVWGDPDTIVANGPPAHVESVAVDAGFRLSGRWMFSSGCRHATWLAAVSPLGDSRQRLHLLPKDEVTLIDVWQVQGLRGTGSFHFETNDQFVPVERTGELQDNNSNTGPLYVIPRNLLFACGFGSVALGVSRAGLDATVQMAKQKTAQFSTATLANNAVVQQKIGKAEARWRGAKALLDNTTASVWRRVVDTLEISLDDRIALRLASTHAIREAAEVVDVAYSLSGSHAVFSRTPIQRHFQDAHAITQQVQGRESHYESVGQHALGLEPTGIF